VAFYLPIDFYRFPKIALSSSDNYSYEYLFFLCLIWFWSPLLLYNISLFANGLLLFNWFLLEFYYYSWTWSFKLSLLILSLLLLAIVLFPSTLFYFILLSIFLSVNFFINCSLNELLIVSLRISSFLWKYVSLVSLWKCFFSTECDLCIYLIVWFLIGLVDWSFLIEKKEDYKIPICYDYCLCLLPSQYLSRW